MTSPWGCTVRLSLACELCVSPLPRWKGAHTPSIKIFFNRKTAKRTIVSSLTHLGTQSYLTKAERGPDPLKVVKWTAATPPAAQAVCSKHFLIGPQTGRWQLGLLKAQVPQREWLRNLTWWTDKKVIINIVYVNTWDCLYSSFPTIKTVLRQIFTHRAAQNAHASY